MIEQKVINNLKNTIRHTFVYSIGNISTKLIGVVLLPLYTSNITVSDYGVLGILEVSIMILTQLFLLGQNSAVLRFYHLDEYVNKKNQMVYTLFLFIVFSSLVIFFICFSLSSVFAGFFSQTIIFTEYFKLASAVIFLRVVGNFLLSIYRAREKSVIYVTANIIKIIAVLTLNVYFIVNLNMGLTGILWSYLIGEALLILILGSQIIMWFTPKFDKTILKSSLTFGFPLIFSAIAVMLLNMGDRYLLKLLVNYHEVGLYNLGYKIAGLINVLFIQSFTLSFLPLAYKMYGKTGDKRYYSKMLTYFTFVLVWAGLALCYFNEDFIHIFAKNKAYWPASAVVPPLVLAYIFSGANYIVMLGIFLKKKTHYIVINNISAFGLNIVLNLILIPSYKMVGAAYATLISFILLFLLSYFRSMLIYKIPFEVKKFIVLIVVGIFLQSIPEIITINKTVIEYLLKFSILMSFPLILYFMKFYDDIELNSIKRVIKKIGFKK